MRLTVGMLHAMRCALQELLAGECPQGVDEGKEAERIMNDADKSLTWIAEKLAKRKALKQGKK